MTAKRRYGTKMARLSRVWKIMVILRGRRTNASSLQFNMTNSYTTINRFKICHLLTYRRVSDPPLGQSICAVAFSRSGPTSHNRWCRNFKMLLFWRSVLKRTGGHSTIIRAFILSLLKFANIRICLNTPIYLWVEDYSQCDLFCWKFLSAKEIGCKYNISVIVGVAINRPS